MSDNPHLSARAYFINKKRSINHRSRKQHTVAKTFFALTYNLWCKYNAVFRINWTFHRHKNIKNKFFLSNQKGASICVGIVICRFYFYFKSLKDWIWVLFSYIQSSPLARKYCIFKYSQILRLGLFKLILYTVLLILFEILS